MPITYNLPLNFINKECLQCSTLIAIAIDMPIQVSMLYLNNNYSHSCFLSYLHLRGGHLEEGTDI